MVRIRTILLALLLLAMPIAAVHGGSNSPSNSDTSVAQDEEFIFGLVMVGPHDDHGWSQAHYEAGLYVEEHVPGTKMIWNESINPADNPDRPLSVVVEDMVDQGAKLIIANSDDFKNDVLAVAPQYPDVIFLHAS